jgi:hypothetical protein
MKRHLIRFTFLIIACVLCVAVQAPAQIAGRQDLCPARPIPTGWIKVDVRPDASTCPAGEVKVIELWTDKAPGSAMVVCADQPTPPGWETLGFATSTGQCAGVNSAAGDVKTIRRVG